MSGRVHQTLAAPQAGAASRFSADRGLVAALAALSVGAVSLFSPPLAMLGVTLLAARVLFSGESVRIDWLTLVGPVFAAVIVGAFFGLPGAIGALFIWRLLVDTRCSIGEARFADLSQPLVARMRQPVERALRDARLQPGDLRGRRF